jgi:uncharacterized protein (TIGR01244 family)
MQINPVSSQFSTTAQISLEDIEQIAQQGYKTIVNFRPDNEGGETQPKSADLEAKAKSLGLSYVYIPVIPNQIQPEQVNKLAAILGSEPAPILGFCRTGNRANNVYQQAHNLTTNVEGQACAIPQNGGCKIIAWFKRKCLITN